MCYRRASETRVPSSVDSLAPCFEYLTTVGVDHTMIAAAMARDPRDPLPIYELADVCRRHGRTGLWRRAVDWAYTLPHESHRQIYRRGSMKLLADDWSGWLDWESRVYDPSARYLDTEFVRHLRYETVPWNGHDDLSGRSILLIADGSLGDCLQMLRYVPLIAALAGRVILSVRPEAARLVREVLGASVTVMLHGAKPTIAFDRYSWLMSLPALCGELPPPLPVRFQRAQTPCRPTDELTYGVCVRLDSTDSQGRIGAMPPEALTSLLLRDGVRWLNLHIGVPGPLITLFDAAKVIMTLGGIVTIDTAVAHLAGMLGIQTWLLLDSVADARWGLSGTTPWYPSMRIFRQQTPGDWASPVAELRASMDAALASASGCP
jgi:hypothetical protein